MNRSIRLPLAIAASIAIAAIGFGAGFGVNALADDDEEPSQSSSVVTVPGLASGEADQTNRSSGGGTAPSTSAPGANPVSYGGAEDGDAKLGILPYPGYGCTVALPATLTSTGISLPEGFDLRTPGPGFELRSFSISREGPCEGQTDTDVPLSTVVITNWRHTEHGVDVTLTQRESSEPTGNMLGNGYASVWVDGYTFNLNAYTNIVYLEGEKPLVEAELSRSGSIRAPDADPNVRLVLLQALSALAPSVAEQCYAQEVPGDWEDLASLGIGDPRGAIPSGFELTGYNLQYFQPAADGCDTPDPEWVNTVNFWANWNSANGSSYLSVNVNGHRQEEGQYPGQLNGWNANWTNGNLSFNIYGSAEGKDGIGVDAIRQIALALDPGFEQACFVSENKLTAGDLGGFNVSAPSADGYKVAEERLVSWEPTAGCANNPNAQAGFSFFWSLEDGTNVVSVNVEKPVYRSDDGERHGYISESSIGWQRADGVYVHISSYGREGGLGAGLDALKAIALQIDPNVDFDALEEGPIAIPVDVGGGASTDAAAPRP